METAKYYTPEIEEFHVGFEFETCYLETDWVKKTLTFDDFGFYTSTWNVDSTPKTEFRVKYLDQEDIESLGFKRSGLESMLYLFKEEIKLLPHLEKSVIGLNYTGINNHCLIFTKTDVMEYGLNIFVGNIKNKSELKKLMVQLNILKND